MFCKKCGNEAPDGSQFCSACGAPIAADGPGQSSKEKHLGTKKGPSKTGCALIVVGIIVIIILIARVGQNGNSTSSSVQGSGTASNKAGQDSHSNTTPSEYKVGDVVKLNNHCLVVTDVTPNFQSGNMFDKPQNSANEFVAVHVVLKNTSDGDIPINSFGFQLEDQTGTKREESIIVGIDDQLESVTLTPGGQVEGNIGFEAKKNSSVLKLHYAGGIFGGGDVVVNLKAGK